MGTDWENDLWCIQFANHESSWIVKVQSRKLVAHIRLWSECFTDHRPWLCSQTHPFNGPSHDPWGPWCLMPCKSYSNSHKECISEGKFTHFWFTAWTGSGDFTTWPSLMLCSFAKVIPFKWFLQSLVGYEWMLTQISWTSWYTCNTVAWTRLTDHEPGPGPLWNLIHGLVHSHSYLWSFKC